MSAEIINLDRVFNAATPLVSRADAMALGLKRYFTGKPCKHGHIAERRLNDTSCLQCERRRYIEKQSIKVAWQKHYNEINRDKVNASNRRNYQKNVAFHRVRHREYYQANREDRIAKQRTWAIENPEIVRANLARRRANKRLAIVTPDADAIMRQVTNEGGKCFYCAVDLMPFEGHAEHIVPLSRGGPHAELNLVLSCATCNLRKSARLPSEWDRLPKRHAARALAREREIIEWNDAQILGLSDDEILGIGAF